MGSQAQAQWAGLANSRCQARRVAGGLGLGNRDILPCVSRAACMRGLWAESNRIKPTGSNAKEDRISLVAVPVWPFPIPPALSPPSHLSSRPSFAPGRCSVASPRGQCACRASSWPLTLGNWVSLVLLPEERPRNQTCLFPVESYPCQCLVALAGPLLTALALAGRCGY